MFPSICPPTTTRPKEGQGQGEDKTKTGKTHTKTKTKQVTTGKYKLSGPDRRTAVAELADYKAQVAEQRKQVATDARAALAEAKTQAISTLPGNFDIFSRGIGPGSVATNVSREIAAVTAYGQMIVCLKSAKASGALGAQVIATGDTGDLQGAVRFGNALLAQPAVLGQLNSSLATVDKVRGNVATLTTDPRPMASAAWNPTSTVVSQKTATVLLQADPSTWMATLRTQVTHDVINALGFTS